MTKKPNPFQTQQELKPAIRAYLGGSFNPVHNGHVQIALTVYNSLVPIATEQQRELQVSLLPNARSPFKAQSMDPAQRLAMLKIALQDTPLQISELELWQTPPVYSIDSVRTLRQRYPNDSLIFIMGMDSARSLDRWKDGLQLTHYVHLWIFNRSDHYNSGLFEPMIAKKTPNTNFSAQEIATLTNELPVKLQAQVTDRLIDLAQPINSAFKDGETLQDFPLLKSSAQGRIYIDPRPVLAVSSTTIRQQLHKQLQTDAIIADTDTDTDTDTDNLAKYLNPTVYRYIIAHQLYSTVQFR